MDQVTQLMDDHIIHDAVRCLDDVPVEDHLPLLVAGPPAGSEVPNGHPSSKSPRSSPVPSSPTSGVVKVAESVTKALDEFL